ncbi:MAG: FecR domain-containing protein [Spirochaetes bacterium]|nr:FecR domain-containing protein [Spirochaetota bacterium]
MNKHARFVPASVLTLALLAAFALISCHKQPVSTGAESFVVTRVQGPARLLRGEKALPVTKGLRLEQGDVLTTAAEGSVDFTLENRGLFQLGPDSHFTLGNLQGARSVQLKLQKGKVLLVLHKLGANDSFQLQTPTAIAGVRGTSFVVTAAADRSRVVVLTGKVALDVGAKSVEVEGKQEAFAASGAPAYVSSIRGSSVAAARELLALPGVEAMPDFEAMKANLRLLELGDQKLSDEELRLRGELQGQSFGGTRGDVREGVSGGTNKATRKRTDQFSSDKDLMVK